MDRTVTPHPELIRPKFVVSGRCVGYQLLV